MALQQEKASVYYVLRCPDLWLQYSLSFVQEKYIILVWCIFFKLCTKLTLHCTHRSGHLETEHTEILLLLRRHLENWSRGPAVSMRGELLDAQEKLGMFSLVTVCCAWIGWEIISLKTSKTAPFFCVCPVLQDLWERLSATEHSSTCHCIHV
jgi:hypothetical protein